MIVRCGRLSAQFMIDNWLDLKATETAPGCCLPHDVSELMVMKHLTQTIRKPGFRKMYGSTRGRGGQIGDVPRQ